MVKVTGSGMDTKCSMKHTIMQSLTFIALIVSENIATLAFLPRQLAGRPPAQQPSSVSVSTTDNYKTDIFHGLENASLAS